MVTPNVTADTGSATADATSADANAGPPSAGTPEDAFEQDTAELSENFFPTFWPTNDRKPEDFVKPLSTEDQQALYCKYLDAVEQARESGCSCCNTVQPSCDMTIVTADDDGLKDLLKPLVPVEFPPDAILPEGLLQQFNLGGDVADFLLSPHGVEEKDDAGVATAVRLCKTCYKSSANGLLPQRALANGLASDAYVPPELADLSEAEVRLISMYTPGAKMVCVTPHGGRQTLYSSSFTVINNFEQLVKKVVFPGYRRQFLRGLCGV